MLRLCAAGVLLFMFLVACDSQSRNNYASKRSSQQESHLALHVELGSSSNADTDKNKDVMILKKEKMLRIDFRNKTLEQKLKQNGDYDPERIKPHHLTVDERRDRMMVTTPCGTGGVPASLHSMSLSKASNSSLMPYPDMGAHRTKEDSNIDCNKHLVSVMATAITSEDEDIMYVLDSGVLNFTKTPKHVCPPKIVTFDLRTDTAINVTIIKNASCNSLYFSLWVDGWTGYCSDTKGHVLTVVNLLTGQSKHLYSPHFQPNTVFSFTITGGISLYNGIGLHGIVCSPTKVYAQALCSNEQLAMDKQAIESARDGDILDTMTKVAMPGELPGPSGPMAIDNKGYFLFFPHQDSAIYCWDTRKPHDKKNFKKIAQYKNWHFISSLWTNNKRLYGVVSGLTPNNQNRSLIYFFSIGLHNFNC